MTEYLKIGLFGDAYVGKTAIAKNFTQGDMDYECRFSSGEYLSKMISVTGQNIDIDIVDESKTIREWRDMRYRFYAASDAFIFVYSVIDRASFETIEELYNEICAATGSDHIYAIIAGNKCDLRNEDSVPFERAQELANKLNCKVLETSALTSFNIDELFKTLAADVFPLKPQESNSHQADRNNGDGCCLIL